MPLIIDDPEAESLARELADYTGESITQAVIIALRERLEREQRRRQPGMGALISEPILRRAWDSLQDNEAWADL
jgi:hypothetical protein